MGQQLWDTCHTSRGALAKPEREEAPKIDLSFLEEKPPKPERLFLDKNFQPTEPAIATYIAYAVPEHDQIVERLKQAQFSEEALKRAVVSLQLKHEIIQDLKQEQWLTVKQLRLEEFLRKREAVLHEKEITWYRIKDVLFGVGSATILIIGLLGAL